MIDHFDIPKILKTALKNGGDFADIFEENSVSTQIVREGKRFDRVAQGYEGGVGIRVLYHGKTAYACQNEISEESLLRLAGQLAAAIQATRFERNILLHPVSPHWQPGPIENPREVPLSRKAEIVKNADRVAWGYSRNIQQVTTLYRDQERRICIANSLGEFCRETQNYLVFVSQVVAAKGEVIQTGYEPLGGTQGMEIFSEDAAIRVARIAADRAVKLLEAPLAPSGTMPVVLAAEAGGTMVHEAVGHGLEADLAREGLSVYQNKLGKRVANELITVVDDPTLPGKRGSFQFDDEGTPAQRNILIEKGVLKNYMYNRLYALKDGVSSTGNGRRESYQNRPICRMTNTLIAPGDSDPDSILRSVPKGFLVKRMGSGQVNTVNGDFVFEVSEGYLICNGKIDHLVRGATLTGNGPQVLNTIDRVGKDMGYGLGTCGKEGQGVPVADGQPTLRIPELVVGGQ